MDRGSTPRALPVRHPPLGPLEGRRDLVRDQAETARIQRTKIMALPPPLTFEQGQRKLFGLLMAIAGICYGLAALAAAGAILWLDWPKDLDRLRLCLIGGALGGAVLGSMAVTIALAVGGPVGRFKVSASKEGATIEAESDASASIPIATPAPKTLPAPAPTTPVLSPKAPPL